MGGCGVNDTRRENGTWRDPDTGERSRFGRERQQLGKLRAGSGRFIYVHFEMRPGALLGVSDAGDYAQMGMTLRIGHWQ